MRKFFNTSGLLYKTMELKSKLPEMNEEEMLMLLAVDGMLVKRPLAIGDGFVLIGFKEAECRKVAQLVTRVIKEKEACFEEVTAEVKALCEKFPVYANDIQ